MKLTKIQIQRIKSAHKKAKAAEGRFHLAVGELANSIIDSTGVDGNIDFFIDDGFGFNPLINNDTHISIDDIIKMAENGEDITEDKLKYYCTF